MTTSLRLNTNTIAASLAVGACLVSCQAASAPEHQGVVAAANSTFVLTDAISTELYYDLSKGCRIRRSILLPICQKMQDAPNTFTTELLASTEFDTAMAAFNLHKRSRQRYDSSIVFSFPAERFSSQTSFAFEFLDQQGRRHLSYWHHDSPSVSQYTFEHTIQDMVKTGGRCTLSSDENQAKLIQAGENRINFVYSVLERELQRALHAACPELYPPVESQAAACTPPTVEPGEGS